MDWESMLKGANCPLCLPREENNEYRKFILHLSISTLYLFTDQRFRGYSLLVYNGGHITGLEQLTDEDYKNFMNDVRKAGKAIAKAMNADHMNYESLGNSNPHLHWHIVPRYKGDPRWGQPIWEGWVRNEFNLNRYVLSDNEYSEIISKIKNELEVL